MPDADANAKTSRPGRHQLPSLLSLRPYLVRHPGMLAAALVALMVSAAAMLVVPLAVRRMIDVGFAAHDGGFIDRYFVTLVGIGLVLAVASASRMYAVNWLGERVVADLRTDVFGHLATLGPAFYERNHSGEVMSRLTADTTQIKAAAGTALSQALRNLIMLAGALTMMFVTSPMLAALALGAIPLIVFPLLAYGRAVRRLSRAAQDRLADASAYAAENLAAVRTMHAFSQQPTVSRRFAAAVERAFEAARVRLVARAGLTAIAIALVVTSIVGILWFGSRLVVGGDISGGRLGQFVLYAVFAAGAIAELSEVWGEIAQAAGAAERLLELLAARSEVAEPPRPRPLPVPPVGSVAFENVRFAYPTRTGTPALDGVSFEARPGETIAIVGPSGAGKSTIFNLLLRFYDPQSGRVAVDGVPVAEASLAELRARIALVPQDVALFDDTIADNIRYGRPDAGDADVARAAAAAQADDFIRALPEGYATRLGERGLVLSGGQRQRIALARALLRDAPILLLDEATSALDAESEQAVQAALARAAETRTTLVIAHRLATVQRASHILVLDQGRIVEEGRHAELLRRGGLYSRLAELQFALDAAQ
ncbi:MAG TPA: ABC transporter transmembrane domain-containing protein [Hyphomicrobiaceae bacterium]|nr:ABC transporter transmembrane domain-containing protein [Hyphomicrobiaceae bacterium]